MKSTKVSATRGRAVVISSLAAKLLGHSRVAGFAMTPKHISVTFPTFNAQELANAVDELLEKQLMRQKGAEGHDTYLLTDYGREGRVAIA